jgi:hypothetical protein
VFTARYGLYLCVYYISQNKQRLFPYNTIMIGFYNPDGVFTARYELNFRMYMFQVDFPLYTKIPLP